MLRIVKPKTRRARRILEARAPKLNENVKKAILLHGTKTSAVVKGVLSDLHHLKKSGGCALKLTQRNKNVRPFEGGGEASLEFFSQKADCSLFVVCILLLLFDHGHIHSPGLIIVVRQLSIITFPRKAPFGSHSKKRPDNLVVGRMFDHHVYDMLELGVERFTSIGALGGGGKYAPQVGSKPCFVFVGADFETRPELVQLKETLLDFFRGEVVENINLAGIDRVFVVVAAAGKVYLRHCAIRLKKSGTKVPKIELVPAGPMLDLVVRRHRGPAEDLRKEAFKGPKSITKKKVKNVSTDSLIGKVGRIYMPKQEVGSMALMKPKGVKRERREAAAERAIGKPGLSSKKLTSKDDSNRVAPKRKKIAH
eukprot:jgi/Mesen1/9493/ME000063S08948